MQASSSILIAYETYETHLSCHLNLSLELRGSFYYGFVLDINVFSKMDSLENKHGSSMASNKSGAIFHSSIVSPPQNIHQISNIYFVKNGISMDLFYAAVLRKNSLCRTMVPVCSNFKLDTLESRFLFNVQDCICLSWICIVDVGSFIYA